MLAKAKALTGTFYLPPEALAPGTMEVRINNEPFEIPDTCTLSEAVQHAGIPLQKGIALAVNNTVIPKANWASESLKANDNIMVIRATQGG